MPRTNSKTPVCLHLGDELPALKAVSLGLVPRKIYRECERGHGPQCRCDGKCGPVCVDYEPDTPEPESKNVPPRRRHLAFHIYPAKSSTVWRRAVEQLRLRWHLFDGVKAVAVCTVGDVDTFATVAGAFSGLGADVFPVEDHSGPKGLREVASWEPLWERILADANEDDVAFYAHAKGVSRRVNPGCMTHRWASLLYHLNLDYWPDVERLLKRVPIVGAFKKTGYGFGRAGGRFHYSGTFYWVRLDDFRRRYSASKPPRVWTGAESWPGIAYDVGEAGCVWGENVQSKLDLYSPKYWKSTVIPEWSEWLRKAVPSRSAGG